MDVHNQKSNRSFSARTAHGATAVVVETENQIPTLIIAMWRVPFFPLWLAFFPKQRLYISKYLNFLPFLSRYAREVVAHYYLRTYIYIFPMRPTNQPKIVFGDGITFSSMRRCNPRAADAYIFAGTCSAIGLT
jgi:hypothetical protein